MSTPTQEQSRREALEIAMWAQGRPAPLREAWARLARLSADSGSLDHGSQEKGVGNSYGTDDSELPDLGPLASFGSWQSVAATILRKAEESAGFDPSSTEFDLGEWVSLEWQFRYMPFLTDIVDDSRSASISSLSLLPAIEAVYYSIEFDGVVPMDAFDGIVTSIKKIGQLAVEHEGQPEKNSNVQQGVLTVVRGDLRLGLLRTTVRMEYRTGKGYQHLNQDITVSRLNGSLDYDKCKRNADELLEWDGQDVDDWVNGACSSRYPPNTSPAWDT
ncbi:hypothetical protein ABZS76_02195 [Streptomyces sp. NPDC005562]|uniref:hypothetical protein n=1 Tax=unclassified Streptomyces TaxID=2593676 RepID=UPI0033BEE879